jgi:hypothetical protein
MPRFGPSISHAYLAFGSSHSSGKSEFCDRLTKDAADGPIGSTELLLAKAQASAAYV